MLPTPPRFAPRQPALTGRARSGYNTPRLGSAAMTPTMSGTALFKELVSGRRRGTWATIARLSLSVASVPYGAGIRVKNRLFDAGWKRVSRAGVPVVSVGN